jgi:hypothetical protein
MELKRGFCGSLHLGFLDQGGGEIVNTSKKCLREENRVAETEMLRLGRAKGGGLGETERGEASERERERGTPAFGSASWRGD